MKKIIKKVLNYFGFKISRNSTTSNNQNNHIDSFKMQKQLVKDANEEIVVFDIGAYVGSVASKYKKLFPNSKIYCFEPFPESYYKLVNNTSNYSNITCINKGLSESEGIFEFQMNTSAPTNSLLKTSRLSSSVWGDGLLETVDTVNVKITTLDNFVDENRIKKIDILKMDVQGAEYMVLNGAKKTLEKGIVNMIYTEIIMLPTYEGQIPFDKTIKLIRSFGFELFNFYNHSLTKEGQLRQVDAIFIKSSHSNEK